MTHEIIVAGFGGQGVMAVGKTLVEAGMKEDLQVSWLPSYGPEMRGGTANCSVVISTDPVGSPVVLDPTGVIAMSLPALIKYEPLVQPGGTLLVNSSLIREKATRDDIRVIYVPCTDIANDIGNPKVANMVMLGAFIAATECLRFDTIHDMLALMFTGSKAGLVALNEQALERGAACAAE